MTKDEGPANLSLSCCGGHHHTHSVSRRSLLTVGALGAAGIAASGLIGRAGAAPAAKGPIDVHHHIFPPIFAKMWAESPGWTANSTDPVLKLTQKWSPSWMIERLDEAGVGMAVMSNNDRPFTGALPIEQRRTLAREVNDYAAKLASDNKGRLGQFAYLPMPDVDGSLKEVAYTLDTLKVHGVHMMTSYTDPRDAKLDVWLGDPMFDPLFQELNRRKATVFVHPRAPNCCRNLMPYVPAQFTTLIEYPYDTGHTIESLLVTGQLAKYRQINWIFCHTGSVIPGLALRFDDGAKDSVDLDFQKVAPQGITAELQRLNWDTAGYTSRPLMAALLAFTSIDHVLFGTDTPFVTPSRNLSYLSTTGLTEDQKRLVMRENALRLMPALATV
jgi:predicted TIM-barrel fold metal-dependent hydrolase